MPKDEKLEIEKAIEGKCSNLFDDYFDSMKMQTIKNATKEQLLVTVKFLSHMLSYNMWIRPMDWAKFDEFYYDYLHNGIQK